MHLAPPALLAALLAAATLVPANAQAPTGPSPGRSRVAAGTVEVPVAITPIAAAAREVVASSTVEPAPAAAVERPTLVAQAELPARPAPAARPRRVAARSDGGAPATRSCDSVAVDPPTVLTMGKSRVVKLPFPASRLIVGGQPGTNVGVAGGAGPRGDGVEAPAGATPGAGAANSNARSTRQESWDGVARADVVLLSPTELFFLGRRTGTMNVVLQANDGRCLVKDIVVTIDPDALQAKLGELMPDEAGVKVRGADDALVLTGTVTDSIKLDQVLALAGGYGDGKKVVNLLRVTAPQQVMLEVKIAEVSKTLLDRFGLDFSRVVTSADGLRTSVISGILGGAPGVLGLFGPNLGAAPISGTGAAAVTSDSAAAAATTSPSSRGASVTQLDMRRRDGVIRVLAEPNIMAISGQAASFLSGGRIFIPVAQSSASGGAPTITLQEKEFGVSIKFTPTVLDGRINLKVASEVSELSQTGTPFTTINNVTAVLPSLTTRKVDTTVQLADGQSFAVAGLIRNNMTEALNKFPGLGEAPIVGALFRSSEFQNDQTELMFVVTPRLVKPVLGPITLPTDNHVPPSRGDVILRGSGEGSGEPSTPSAPAPVQPAAPAPAPASRP